MKKLLYFILIVFLAYKLIIFGFDYDMRDEYSKININYRIIKTDINVDIPIPYLRYTIFIDNLPDIIKYQPKSFKRFIFCFIKRKQEEFQLGWSKFELIFYTNNERNFYHCYGETDFTDSSAHDAEITERMKSLGYDIKKGFLNKEEWDSFRVEECECRWSPVGSFINLKDWRKLLNENENSEFK